MKLYGGRPSRESKKSLTALIALILIICLAVGGTVAFVVTQTQAVKNTFTPSDVKVDIQEDFDGSIKKNVNVKNTGDTDAYIRVKLVTYMADSEGNPTAENASIPAFVFGSDWLYCESDDTYYYGKPVAPNGTTSDLIGSDGITLTDGQVVEVLAEGIQSVPDNAVEEAWPAVQVVNGELQIKGAGA